MKKIILGFLGLLICITPVQNSKAVVGLLVKAGMFYTAYKFVDGIVEGSISNFVDQYIDGPIDLICSFGKGVQTFGTGVRNVIIGFSNDKSNNAFSNAWQELKNQFDFAVIAGQAEWSTRRKAAKQKKKIIEPMPTKEVLEPLKEQNVIRTEKISA